MTKPRRKALLLQNLYLLTPCCVFCFAVPVWPTLQTQTMILLYKRSRGHQLSNHRPHCRVRYMAKKKKRKQPVHFEILYSIEVELIAIFAIFIDIEPPFPRIKTVYMWRFTNLWWALLIFTIWLNPNRSLCHQNPCFNGATAFPALKKSGVLLHTMARDNYRWRKPSGMKT